LAARISERHGPGREVYMALDFFRREDGLIGRAMPIPLWMNAGGGSFNRKTSVRKKCAFVCGSDPNDVVSPNFQFQQLVSDPDNNAVSLFFDRRELSCRPDLGHLPQQKGWQE
jgi:hypothetical protein